MKKIGYYPGCTLKTKAKIFEKTALYTAEKLGYEFIELPNWNCCGAVFSLSSDDLIHHLAPIRNLVRVQDMKEGAFLSEETLVTLCSMCFNTLKRANIRYKNSAEDRSKIKNIMDTESAYQGNVSVLHFLELFKSIEPGSVKLKRKLKGLKVFVYYGCTLLRPKEASLDDAEAPVILERYVETFGAEALSTPFSRLCCGSYQTVNAREKVVELAYKILTSAIESGADAVITACPLCFFNLKDIQNEICAAYPDFKGIPVAYFTELSAYALGMDPGEWDEEPGFIKTALAQTGEKKIKR